MTFRIHYVDDSGSAKHGIAVFSWVEVDATRWKDAVDTWLAFREKLWRRHGIPPEAEIHSYSFVPGRGNPSKDESWNRSKPARWAVFTEAMGLIRELPGVTVGAVYRPTDCRRDAFTDVVHDVYLELVERIDARLGAAGAQGLIVMDGDGTALRFRDAHRDLSGDNLVENPLFERAHLSQWIQIADIVAYSAFQAVARQPTKQFCWSWYNQYFGDDPFQV